MTDHVTPETTCPECYGKGLAGQDDRPGLLIDPIHGTSECPRCRGGGKVAVTDHVTPEQFDPKHPEKGWHPATPLPEPRLWKLWRWLRLMP